MTTVVSELQNPKSSTKTMYSTTYNYANKQAEALRSSCTQSRFHIVTVYPIPRQT